MFITLEGIEGSGKTTQVKRIGNFLKEEGKRYILTREPGGTRIGQKIRAILLDPENKDLVSEAELLLYVADRIQHVREIIEPASVVGTTVVCDRFFDATTVYQGYARGLDIDLIFKLHDLFFKKFKPDITFLLDLPVEMGLIRAKKQLDCGERDNCETRFEKEELEFHYRLRGGYLKEAEKDKRWFIIDASKSEIKVWQKIRIELERRLPYM